MSGNHGNSPSVVRRIGCGRSSIFLIAAQVAAAGCGFAQTSLDEQLSKAQEEADNPAIIEIATRLQKERPDDEALLYAIAQAEIANEDKERAQATISKWLAAKPGSPLAEETNGDLLAAKNLQEEAIAAWTAALAGAAQERKAEIWRKVGSAQAELKHYKESAEAWQTAFDADGQPMDLMHRADVLVDAGKFDEAVADARKAGQLAPDDQSVKSSLPKFERLEQSLPVIHQLAKVSKDDPSNFIPARTRLAFILGATGFPDAGLIYAQEAVAAKTEAFGPVLVAGFLYRTTGNSDAAADLLISNRMPAEAHLGSVSRLIENVVENDTKILKGSSDSLVWIQQLQRVKSLIEPWFGAERADAALNLYPNNPQILALKAWFLNSSSQPGASAAVEQALKLNPKLADAWVTRGLIARRNGDLAGALQSYRKAAELGDTSVTEDIQLLDRTLPRVATAKAVTADKANRKESERQ